jgi:hypothetical protein
VANGIFRVILVNNQQHAKQSIKLESLNEELTTGLERCHELVEETRTKLIAAANDASGIAAPNDNEEGSNAARG